MITKAKCKECGQDFTQVLITQTICCNCLPVLSDHLTSLFDTEHKHVIRKPEYNIHTDSQYSTDEWSLN